LIGVAIRAVIVVLVLHCGSTSGRRAAAWSSLGAVVGHHGAGTSSKDGILMSLRVRPEKKTEKEENLRLKSARFGTTHRE
jgi:hypothetical protein